MNTQITIRIKNKVINKELRKKKITDKRKKKKEKRKKKKKKKGKKNLSLFLNSQTYSIMNKGIESNRVENRGRNRTTTKWINVPSISRFYSNVT